MDRPRGGGREDLADRPGVAGRLRRALADDLFPAAPPQRLTPRATLTGAAAVVALIALSLLRQAGGVGVLDSIWAEDGSIFLQEAVELPVTETLGRGYAGYLHAVPRLAAAAVALFPLPYAATLLALTGAAVVAGAAVLVYAATAGHLRDPAVRAGLAALVVLQPIVGVESLNSIALVQWPLTFAAFWVSLWRPASWVWAALAGLVLALTVLSAPLALLLVPVLLVRLSVVPTWRDRLPALLGVAAAAVQVTAMVTQRTANAPGGTPAQLAEAWAELVATPAVVGVGLATALRPAVGGWLEVATVTVVAAVVVLALALRPRHRLTVLLAVGLSVVSYTGSVWARGAAARILAANDQGLRPDTTRFAVVAVLLLLTVLALVLDARPARPREATWNAARLLTAALLLLVAGVDLRVTNDRSLGPPWSAEVAEGVGSCRSGATLAAVQVSPPVPDFQFLVECEVLPP